MDISIIMPCYNSGEFLKEAVESLLLYRGVYIYELIIINDGSSDITTINILNTYRQFKETIRIIDQENRGPAAARNVGVSEAKGKFLLFLDSDNVLYPEYIDIGISELKANSNLGVVYAKAQLTGDNSRDGFSTYEFNIHELLAKGYIDMCVVMRKQAWIDAGGMNEELLEFEDWDLFLSIFRANWDFKYIDQELYIYRIRKDSVSDRFRNNPGIRENTYNQIALKHSRLYFDSYKQIYTQLQINKKELWLGSVLMKIPKIIKHRLKM